MRKIPMRRCLATNKSFPKKELLRIVKTPEGDVSRLLNAKTDLSSTMFGMARINDDACLFVTYKKQDPEDEKNYIDGKPDYADSFKDEYTFEWMTQIGQGLESKYYKKVKTAKNIRLFVQKRTSDKDFYYLLSVLEQL